MARKLIGPNFKTELDAAGCPNIGWGADGLIEVHALTGGVYERVTLTCEVGQDAVDVRTAEVVGTYSCVTEAQITAIKAVLTAHNPAVAFEPDTAKRNLDAMLAARKKERMKTLKQAIDDLPEAEQKVPHLLLVEIEALQEG